MLTKVSR